VPTSDRQLKWEEEWYRIYSSSSHPNIYESKFVTGEVQISLAELKPRWEHWHAGERVQFAQAFGQKQTLTSEDERVLDFLMGEGGEEVFASIARLTTKHSKKNRAGRFLAECLKAYPHNRSNFLHALSLLEAPESVPDLTVVFNESKAKADTAQDYAAIIDLIYCSAGLYRTIRDATYRDEIARYADHPEESIRTAARMCLAALSEKG
jgi:hypothetical protein